MATADRYLRKVDLEVGVSFKTGRAKGTQTRYCHSANAHFR